MVQLKPVVLQLPAPEVAVTVKPLMSAPPLNVGLLKLTVTDAFPAMALTPVGASGVVMGTTAGEADEDALEPAALMATTVKV